jgi:hypothetical protein
VLLPATQPHLGVLPVTPPPSLAGVTRTNLSWLVRRTLLGAVGVTLIACGQPSGYIVGFENLDSADYVIGFSGNSLTSGTTTVSDPAQVSFVLPKNTKFGLGPAVRLVWNGTEWTPGEMNIWTVDCQPVQSFPIPGGEYFLHINPGGKMSLERHDFRNTYPEGTLELPPAEKVCS